MKRVVRHFELADEKWELPEQQGRAAHGDILKPKGLSEKWGVQGKDLGGSAQI